MNGQALAALAVADFRERARRPAYLMILMGAVGLAWLAIPGPRGQWVIVNAGAYRGLYTSAYVGAVTALAGSVWLMIGGFFVVRGAVTRDETTGVGQVLAATPLTGRAYLLGKFLSNLLVLASMAGVLAVTALVLQLVRGESRVIDPVGLLAPFVLLTLPVVAMTAALAVVFETVRPLRAGFGTAVWFPAASIVALAGQGGGAPFGGLGVRALADSMRADLSARGLRASEFSVGFMYLDEPLRVFRWSGLHLSGGFVLGRVALSALAVGVAVLPALWFHRFDTRPAPSARPGRGGTALSAPPAGFAGHPSTVVVRTPRMLGPVVGELRVLMRHASPWWWSVAAVLFVAGFAAPALLPVVWLWPVLLWSRLGAYRFESSTDRLLGAYPGRIRRAVAEWASGLLVTGALGLGPVVRWMASGSVAAVAWWAGVVAIPSLAWLLGRTTRSQRPFQVAYLALWYAAVNGLLS